MNLRNWKSGLGRGGRSLVENTTYLAVAAALTYVVRFIYILVVARVLGPDLYGQLAYCQSWYVTFLPLAVFGVGSVLSREIGRDRAGCRPIVDASLALRFVTSIFAAMLCVSLGWWIAATPEQVTLLAVFSAALVGRGIATWSYGIFVGAEQAGLSLRQDQWFRPAEAVLGIMLVYQDYGVLALAILHASVWWLQALQGIRLVRAKLFAAVPCWDPERMFALAVTGAPIAAVGGLAGWMVTGPLILYARQEGVTPGSVGEFALPMQICSVLFGFILSAGTASLPILSRSVARNDGKHVAFLWSSVGGILVIGGAVSLVCLYAGPSLMSKAFGQRYAGSGELLAAAIALLVPLTVASTAGQVLIARQRNSGLIVSSALGATLFVATLPWLVSELGALGAIAAAAAGATLWAALALVDVSRQGR